MRINWVEWGRGNKPSDHIAYNKKQECLGKLRYQNVGRHMHWCWIQHSEVWMSPSCLDEVREKMKELYHEVRGE